jgi:hypothetical protein
MRLLPMIPASCSLDQAGLNLQLERYRAAGEGAQILEWGKRRLVISVRDPAADATVEDLVEVERRCCPFFQLDWEPRRRVLAVAVSGPEHEPALAAIAVALGLQDSGGAGPATQAG